MKNVGNEIKTPWILRVALVFFGLFLTAAVLEAGLRVGGSVASFVQRCENLHALQRKGAYRILCLGESTTHKQYPRFLEAILNEKGPGIKFSVIDKGVPGTSTSAILGNLGSNLDEFRPDMVVVMMGINDFGVHLPHERPSSSRTVRFLKSFKIYRLFQFLWAYFRGQTIWTARQGFRPECSRFDPDQADATSGELCETLLTRGNDIRQEQILKENLMLGKGGVETYVGLGKLYRSDNPVKAKEYFNKALDLAPDRDDVYVLQGELCAKGGAFERADEYFNKALEINPGNDSAYVGLGWGQNVRRKGWKEAVRFFNKALELNPNNAEANKSLGKIYLSQKMFSDSETFFKKAKELRWSGDSDFFLAELYHEWGKPVEAERHLKESLQQDKTPSAKILGALAVLYEETGRHALAGEYYEKASQGCSYDFSFLVARNYHKLKAVLDRRHIRLVCVQ